MRYYFADISNYQPNFDFRKFEELGGIGVIVKASMQLGFDSHYRIFAEKIRRTNLLFGIYHWVDPIPGSIAKQCDLFSTAIETVHPDFICGDNEQWWADWNKYYLAIQKKIQFSEVPKLSSDRINKFSKDWFEEIHRRFPQLTLFQYTGKWFIDGYCPQVKNWISQYPLWLAEYRKIDKVQRLEDLVITGSPKLPDGTGTWEIWQFSSSMYLPGVNQEYKVDRPFDINIIRRDIDDFKSFINLGEKTKIVRLKSDIVAIQIRREPKEDSEFISTVSGEIEVEKSLYNNYYKLVSGGYIPKEYIE